MKRFFKQFLVEDWVVVLISLPLLLLAAFAHALPKISIPTDLQTVEAWRNIAVLFALALALPDEQTDRQLGRALRRMPVLFLLTAANLFRLRGTKDKFIHTEHTGAGGNAPGANTPTEP